MEQFQKLDRIMNNRSRDFTTSFGGFVNDYRKHRESESIFTIMTMNEFIIQYTHTIDDMWGNIVQKQNSNESRYQIYFLVDISDEKKHTMKKDMKQKYRKCGKIRRDKLNHKYKYCNNEFNRIHSFVVVEHSPGISDEKTLAINIICSSNYSDSKGVGSYIMESLIESAKEVGYKSIVLEVGSEQIEDEESDDEESDDEESEDEESEDDGYIEEMSSYIADELWKKSVRHRNGIPYYSFSSEYIEMIILDSIHNEITDQELPVIEQDNEYEYGGYYYKKSKKYSQKLIEFYESMGFQEDSNVHKKLKCFSNLPFPSFKLEL